MKIKLKLHIFFCVLDRGRFHVSDTLVIRPLVVTLADHQKWNFSSQIIALFVKTFKAINAYKWINIKL